MRTPWNLIAIASTCFLFGVLLGALTNAVNGLVSPYYFMYVMGWSSHGVYRASIAQGIFEGSIYGSIFAILFTSFVGIVTKGSVKYREIAKVIVAIALAVICCWALGGGLAVLLAAISPRFAESTFQVLLGRATELLRYAWVGGSIWGAEIGAILSLVVGSVIFRNYWMANQLQSSLRD